MTSAGLCFVAFAKVRIDRQIVSHRVLPSVVIRFVVGKAVAVDGRIEKSFKLPCRVNAREFVNFTSRLISFCRQRFVIQASIIALMSTIA